MLSLIKLDRPFHFNAAIHVLTKVDKQNIPLYKSFHYDTQLGFITISLETWNRKNALYELSIISQGELGTEFQIKLKRNL